ncbi:MAG: hypothetical protein U5K00_04160 [Melioribacteraceae bacterium]|nr:hypothetical protein [Melioribacteraceae bacterium]
MFHDGFFMGGMWFGWIFWILIIALIIYLIVRLSNKSRDIRDTETPMDTLKEEDMHAAMVGGIFTSMIMELTVYPAIFFALKKRELKKEKLLTE